MSMYIINGELQRIPGLDGIYTRRSIFGDLNVVCGCYCYQCENYSNNPGCKIKDKLKIIFDSVFPLFWNALLNKGLIE